MKGPEDVTELAIVILAGALTLLVGGLFVYLIRTAITCS
jgi:hypothetical protein